MRALFDEPQFGVAPGQAVVCFDARNERVCWVGGGLSSLWLSRFQLLQARFLLLNETVRVTSRAKN